MANKRSILVIDDEVNVAETLKMVLEQEGYRVTTACSAAVQNLRSAFGLHVDYVAIKPCEMRDLLLAMQRLFAARESVKPRVVTPRGLSCNGVA